MTIVGKLESILFVASKPLNYKRIAKALDITIAEVTDAVEALKEHYNHESSGIQIVVSGQDVQMVTNHVYTEFVEKFTKSEIMGELTRAQLETLTVVAYQQPITRPEIEQIRGVNCAVILRNLIQRGLVEERDSKDSVMPLYELAVTALRHLGVTDVKELPEYEIFHSHEYIEQANIENE